MYDNGEHTISRSSILYGTNADDVWFNLDQFYKDQLHEVNQKLSKLDDGIWGKIVLMEKNKRIAKAYLRAPRFRIDGSCHEFDGQRIGFKSLNNATRDSVVEEIREKIGVILIKMDQQGNILAKRCEGSSPVIVQGWDRAGAYCQGADVTESRGRLEPEKPSRVFDMRVFKASIEHELRQSYPDRKKLLYKSAVRISLVKDEPHPFKTPCWFMLINLVALDMLNSKVLPVFPAISNSSASETPMSRCQSISSDLHLTGKHMSISSNDLYFNPNHISTSTSTISRQVASPVWSETYEDLAATTSTDNPSSPISPPDRTLSAQMANSLALGYGGYTMSTMSTRPRWSTTLARSMDCIYGTAQGIPLPSVDSSLTNGHLDDQPMVLIVDPSGHYTTRRPEQRKLHNQRCSDSNTLISDKDKNIYGRSGGRRAASATSDSDSSSSGGGTSQQQEIYESSSTNSSNCSSGVSCRPSSPSISSETASESHHSADSMFGTGSSGMYSKIPTSVPSTLSTTSRRGSTSSIHGHTMALAQVAPEPPPRPQSLFKNAIRSKLFGGLNMLNNGDTVLETKRAALARYNNIRLDDTDPSKHSSLSSTPPRTNARVTLFQKNSQIQLASPSDSDSEVYRL